MSHKHQKFTVAATVALYSLFCLVRFVDVPHASCRYREYKSDKREYEIRCKCIHKPAIAPKMRIGLRTRFSMLEPDGGFSFAN